MYRGQTGISHRRNITHEWECTGDRQEYHTDGTLHMSENVQGTDRNITLTEHYTWVGMYRDRQSNEYKREFHNWPFHTNTHTHTQSQIVAYWAATFAAKNLVQLLTSSLSVATMLSLDLGVDRSVLLCWFLWFFFSVESIYNRVRRHSQQYRSYSCKNKKKYQLV